MMPHNERLSSEAILARHLHLLLALDQRLLAVHNIAGPFGLRTQDPGFAGLARIICGQQLSVASARAIWNRLQQRSADMTAQDFLNMNQDDLRNAGLSRNKYMTLKGVAEAIVAGELDFAAIGELPSHTAITALTRYKGIGPWTAEIYLMFCTGHPDIFPAGDLALQKAVSEALCIDPHPNQQTLVNIAAQWAPYRATAALLFWRYYAARRSRPGLPI
ncbi:DNA-3-methyladenine glycosylase 2 family protein [Alcaligenaceae bacterium CGII-47]|nr:DNA-3-methyladenine glycosylase 2 family protein [Alcaligenaceae bacterium CGII-47]